MIEHLSPWITSEQALNSVRATAALCEQLGHHVELVSLPVDAEQFYNDAFTIISVNTQAYVDML
ncbi:amidase, partial [Dickeya dianthicola]|nr:amidase [Dickeya dianthicola]